MTQPGPESYSMHPEGLPPGDNPQLPQAPWQQRPTPPEQPPASPPPAPWPTQGQRGWAPVVAPYQPMPPQGQPMAPAPWPAQGQAQLQAQGQAQLQAQGQAQLQAQGGWPAPAPTGWPAPAYVAVAPGNGLAVAALVLGLLGFFSDMVPIIGVFGGVPMTILAIIFGSVGIAKAGKLGGHNRGVAIAGLVFGILGFLLIFVGGGWLW